MFSNRFFSVFLSLFFLGNVINAQQIVDAKRWSTTEGYTPYETFTYEDIVSSINPSINISLSKYGGRTDRQYEASGFFRLEKLADRWIMVDPDGYEYIQVGCNAVVPDENYKAKYNSTSEWAAATTAFFKENGFNAYGLWSKEDEFTQHPMPYARWGFFMGGYLSSKGIKMHTIPHDERDLMTLPIFDPEFETFCNEQARRYLLEAANDPYLIGIFSDNELPFNENSLDLYLALPETDPNYIATRDWLEEQGISPTASDYSDKLQEEFFIYLLSTYYRITKAAVKSKRLRNNA